MSHNSEFMPQSISNVPLPVYIVPVPRHISTPIAVVVSIVLCGVYLLLPIERGFPLIRILGYPITLAMVTTFASFLILAILSKGRIFIEGRYIPLQVLFVMTMLMSTMSGYDVQASLFVILNYSLTFIINFIILYNLFLNGYRRHFATVLCIAITIAAILCLLEGLFRIYLPFYFGFFQNFNYNAASYQLIRTDFRALGVLGNPIISSVALTLAIPFVLDLKSKIKYIIIALIIAASLLTATRTILLIWAAYLLGLVILSGTKRSMLFFIFPMMALLFFALPSDITGIISRPITNYLTRDQLGNVQIRQMLFGSSLTYFLGQQDLIIVLLGEGLKSGSLLAYAVGGVSTLDNVYMTVLVETGLIGFCAFAICCIAAVFLYPGKKASMIMHWASILGWLLAGLSFVTIYYATFNLIWVASVALLVHEGAGARSSQPVPSWRRTHRPLSGQDISLSTKEHE
jgi:hypothetical protein